MKTKEEFIARWRVHMAGLALFGVVSEVRESTQARASKALDIPGQVEKLLAQMYEDLGLAKKLETNGHTPATVPMRKASP